MDGDFIAIAEAFLRAVSSDLDPYTSDKGIIVSNERDQNVALFTPAHIQFAKYGRGPGKMPPVDEILKWVSSKGIVSEVREQEGMAWGIAISISKRGTKNWVPNAPDALQEAIGENLEKYYDEVSKKLVSIEMERLNEVYGKNFPEDIEFKI